MSESWRIRDGAHMLGFSKHQEGLARMFFIEDPSGIGEIGFNEMRGVAVRVRDIPNARFSKCKGCGEYLVSVPFQLWKHIATFCEHCGHKQGLPVWLRKPTQNDLRNVYDHISGVTIRKAITRYEKFCQIRERKEAST